MHLFELPNEVLLAIIDKIPMLYCCAFVVTCAPQLLKRNMIHGISRQELLAMKRFTAYGHHPRLGHKPVSQVKDYFQSLPAELWFLVGNQLLKTEDKLNFAAAIWQSLVEEWNVEAVTKRPSSPIKLRGIG